MSAISAHLPGDIDDEVDIDFRQGGRSTPFCLDVTMAIVAVLDNEGTLILLNRYGQEILGLASTEVVGKPWIEEFVPIECRERARILFEDSGSTQNIEIPVRQQDGSELLISWSGATTRDGQGNRIATILTGTDITEQARATDSLRDSESRFRSLFDTVPEAIFVCSEDGTILDINTAACDLQQCDRAELIGSDIWGLVPEKERKSARRNLAYLITGMVSLLEWPAWLVQGKSIPIEVRAQTFVYDGTSAIIVQVQDISDRVKAHNKLIEMEEWARSILDISSDAILVSDEHGRLLWTNGSVERLFGYSADELTKCKFETLVPSQELEEGDSRAKRPLNSKHLVSKEQPINGMGRAKDGKIFPVEVSVSDVNFDGSRHCVAFIRDISQRRALEQEVLLVTEAERQSIGQDIHDLLASAFSGIALVARGMINQIDSKGVDKEALEYIAELARSGAKNARTLALGLNPVAFERYGLKSALAELRQQVLVMTSLSCSLEVPDDLPILNKVCAAQLYRIAYEAVTNTMKHAEAEHVSMSVEYGETELVMRITDDGKGIVRQEEKEGGIGIHIMNYRAQMLHGLVRVQSRPGEGTTVICKIPLSFLSRTDVAA